MDLGTLTCRSWKNPSAACTSVWLLSYMRTFLTAHIPEHLKSCFWTWAGLAGPESQSTPLTAVQNSPRNRRCMAWSCRKGPHTGPDKAVLVKPLGREIRREERSFYHLPGIQITEFHFLKSVREHKPACSCCRWALCWRCCGVLPFPSRLEMRVSASGSLSRWVTLPWEEGGVGGRAPRGEWSRHQRAGITTDILRYYLTCESEPKDTRINKLKSKTFSQTKLVYNPVYTETLTLPSQWAIVLGGDLLVESDYFWWFWEMS